MCVVGTAWGGLLWWVFLAAVAVLVAVEVLGFRTGHLFSQEIWAPEGRARLMQFGALYLAAAAALLILVPWIFAGLATALLVVSTAICIGPLACLAVVFFLLSAWSLGSLIVGRTPRSARDALVPLRSRITGNCRPHHGLFAASTVTTSSEKAASMPGNPSNGSSVEAGGRFASR